MKPTSRLISHGASAQSLYRSATYAALFGLVINLALGLVKLVGGIVGQSFALISDAINSLGDALTSIVVAGGCGMPSGRPTSNIPTDTRELRRQRPRMWRC